MTRYALNSALAGLLLAALPAPALALELEPKCPVEGNLCWIEFANQPGCHAQVWRGKSAHKWYGGCTGGLASGEGLVSRADGSVMEGPYVDGKRHGHWTEHYADGGVGEGPYVDGKRHGHWTERYADGNVGEGPYVDGKQHGHWTVRTDGVVSEGPYVEGKMHGQWTARFADGSSEKVEFRHGERME